MANNKKWDISDSYVYKYGEVGKENYYLGAVLFNDNKTEPRIDSDIRGYWLIIISLPDYNPETNELGKADMFYSDMRLLVECGRRSETNYNKAISMMKESAEQSMEMMEEDRKYIKDLAKWQGISEEEMKNKIDEKKEEIMNKKKEETKMEEKKEDKKDKKVYLKDIAGLQEVKSEVMEVVDAFKNREKYEKFGIKTNLNILLMGLPGCGKTMLGKAIATECDANFIYECGSNFMNKYVGVGADRVRKLYEEARKNAPTVIFIDEGEILLGKRSSDASNGKEQAQTLNQILVELDGMNTTDDVITIVATNRADLMDEAALRPGRFSRKIEVPLLDLEGRRELIRLYAETKPLNKNVDLEELAKMSSGMSGAELFNLINEAAIYAVRKNQNNITMENFKEAYEKISTGLKSQTKKLTEEEKRVTAVHELGHALCGLLLKSNRKISKISILPRNNNTLGFVLYQNEGEDKYIYTKEELMNKIKISLAGKVAEKIVFNHYSSGCQSDLDNVSNIAYNMVTRYGMSNLGSFNMDKDNLFLQEKIHAEMNEIVGKCYKETKALLKANLDILNDLVDFVIEQEEITGEEFNNIYNKALGKRNK